MSDPRPWTCSDCGQQVLWQRSPEGASVVVCRTHGTLATLTLGTEQDQQ